MNDFIDSLKNDIGKIAITTLKKYSKEASQDGITFLQSMESDLTEWGKQYAAGQMSEEELESMVKGKKDLAELIALKKKGLTKIMLDKFVDDVLDIVIKRVIK